MEENIKFRSDFYYDLPAHKEYNQLLMDAMGRNAMMNTLTMCSMLFLLTQLDNTVTLIVTLILNIFYLGHHWFQKVRSKDGGPVYQQILQKNNDTMPHQVVTLEAEGVRSRNPLTKNCIFDPYESVRYMMESQNLLILVTDQRMCHILDKRFINGGSREDVIAFLHENCPRLQKRIKTGKLGSIIRRLLLIVAAVGVILGGFVAYRLANSKSVMLNNNMSYEEMAADLTAIGITITDRTIQELKAYDEEYAAEYGADFYKDNPDASKILDLLYWEGSGIYDEESWSWTPSESGVYWFDTEVFYLDSIYTDFFRGLDAMDENLIFTNVSEDYTGVDMEDGTGTIGVSFDYEGKLYLLNARYAYDWFDLNVLKEVGTILSADSHPENLWFTYDGQAVLLYYGTDAECRILEQKSGLDFQTCGMIGIFD